MSLLCQESLDIEVKLHKSHLADLDHQIQKTQHQIHQLNKIKYRELSREDRITPEEIQRHKETLERRLIAVS